MDGFLQFPDGASVVVTGAGSGIGRATALIAARAGLRVALWDLNVASVHALAQELDALGTSTVVAEVDVTDADAVAAGFTTTSNEFGHIDYLVNNAGPTSHVSQTFNQGVNAAAGSMALVTDGWLALGRRDGDAVVNLSSVAGTHTGVGAEAWYPAAKAAIAGYTRFLALNRPGNIRANAIAPGMIRTPRNEEFIAGPLGQAILERNPMQRAGEASDVGAAVCFLLSPAACYINGVVLAVDGGSLVTL
jgi:NAD(P)-dependent dehydrogenase (short-subunit alcohol dehydrogenase family)